MFRKRKRASPKCSDNATTHSHMYGLAKKYGKPSFSSSSSLLTTSQKKSKTYNSGYSLVVTHLTTNPPVHCLSTAERTGSSIFSVLWSYVKECGCGKTRYHKFRRKRCWELDRYQQDNRSQGRIVLDDSAGCRANFVRRSAQVGYGELFGPRRILGLASRR
jgi:hypothetical protein